MKKIRLLTPGPTPVPERISLRMAQPILHHRSPEFEQVFARCREGLAWLFQTKQDVVQLASSGTGAMEASLVNFLRRGDEAIVIDAGKFGERWGKLAKSYGVNAVTLKVEWGSAVDPGAVKAALEEHPGARAVFVQANESSTGVAHPVQKLAQITRNHPAILVVDAISALGAFDLPFDAWGIDVMVSGSQKALGLPPGLAFLAASEKAWKLNETADLPRFYFDVKRERDNQRKNQTAWTPAISLVQGLDESLQMFREEGLQACFARHERLARGARAGMQALGLKLYSKAPSAAMTTVLAPEGTDSEKLVKHLFKQYGIKLVGGQDAAKGKIFRIAHLGYFDDFDMLVVVGAIERGLRDLGAKAQLGAGLAAAQAAMAEAGAPSGPELRG
ncbi:MAG TPA: alanine--glyoxylate aminotransferase family protein [Myxococcales bacterium]|nr:alanine--glyoxylate aminotransferase family protein [Myxococcales bacterium]